MAAELESRWETALREWQQAEEIYAQEKQKRTEPLALPSELREAFSAIGQKLPQLWAQDILTREQRKALLRCLIDKVVIDRVVPERVQTRIVWRGGDTTRFAVPVTVGSFADLSNAAEMEAIILERSQKGQTDEEIAAHLTALGYRSPMCTDAVLPNTVKIVRLKHGIFLVRSQSHPRQIPGFLTVPQLARQLDVKPHWLYHHINRKRIQVAKDEQTGLYLFPDNPDTLAAFQQFKEGKIKHLRFARRHQDV